MGGSGHRDHRRRGAAGARPAHQVAVDVECEGLECAAQESHRAVGVLAGSPALDLCRPALEPAEAVVRHRAVADGGGFAGEGGEAEDAGAALAGGLIRVPLHDPDRLGQPARPLGQDDDHPRARGGARRCEPGAAERQPELRQGGVKVLNVFFGPLETEWYQAVPPPKVAPSALARSTVRALQQGLEDVFVGDIAEV